MKAKGFIFIAVLAYVTVMFSSILVKQLEVGAHKKAIQNALQRGERDCELILLKIPLSQAHELVWEHSKEFEYRGNMYDIKSSYTQDDTTYYSCVLDIKEKKLKIVQSEFINQLILGDNLPNKLRKNKVKIPKLISEKPHSSAYFVEVNLNSPLLKPYLFVINEWDLGFISPPPDFY